MDKQQISDPADKSELTHQKTKALRGEEPYTGSHPQKNLLSYTTQVPQVQNDQPDQTKKPTRIAPAAASASSLAKWRYSSNSVASMGMAILGVRGRPPRCSHTTAIPRRGA